MRDVVHVEALPGVVTVVAAWVACAGMEISIPGCALSALIDLHRLLIALGFRGDSPDDSNVAREEHDDVCETRSPFDRTPAVHVARSNQAGGNDTSRAQRGDRALGQSPDGSCGRRREGERR